MNKQRIPNRPRLGNLNPVFRKRDKSEDNAVLSKPLIKLARKSGVLNLSGRGLSTASPKDSRKELTSFYVCGPYPHRRYYHIREFRMSSSNSEIDSDNDERSTNVPDQVYCINEADPEVEVTLDSLIAKEEDAWWNQIMLTNLDLSSNTLTCLSSKIENLTSLTTLTLHDNALESIPRELSKLEKLTRLNLSRNKLKELPHECFTLPELRYLNISHNQFEELHPDISDLHMLEVLDASNNQLKSIPCGVGFLVRLTELLLSYNHIKELPSDLVNMRSLRKLDLMHNDLMLLPEDMGELHKLQFLYIQHNDIPHLPNFDGCSDLQELHASNNFLTSIPENFCSKLPHLKILDLRDNQIRELPSDIALLQNLIRLDLSNNSVASVPSSLASLANLVSLQLDGNPIKSIRREILASGTQRILKTLRDRALTSDDNNKTSKMPGDGLNSPRSQRDLSHDDSESIFPDKYKLRKTHCLTVTMQNLTDVPDDIFQGAQEENVGIVNFSKNRLEAFPKGLEKMSNTLQELVLSNNVIKKIPTFVSQFTRIVLMNLSCNYLSDLPKEMALLDTLRELNISNNRFENIPLCIYGLKGLEILLMRNNRIRQIDASDVGLGALPRLANLDLGNNNIDQIPPILGKLTNINSLDITGNLFRQPRQQILEKGTSAIMSYLRDRIPV